MKRGRETAGRFKTETAAAAATKLVACHSVNTTMPFIPFKQCCDSDNVCCCARWCALLLLLLHFIGKQ